MELECRAGLAASDGERHLRVRAVSRDLRGGRPKAELLMLQGDGEGPQKEGEKPGLDIPIVAI